MSSLFEKNEQILDDLEQAEHRLEKIRIDGADKAGSSEKTELASTIKELVTSLVGNIAESGGKVDELGGAIVLPDLAEVLERYQGVFDIPGLDQSLAEVRGMMEE